MKRWLCLLGLLAACAEAPAPTPLPTSALPVAEQAFGPGIFDVDQRRRLFAEATASDLVLPARLDPKRYAFLQVLELRRQSADRREGRVAVAIDGWPVALDFAMARTPAGWQVVSVGPREDQLRWLDLLGPEGLPRARAAERWRGGLAGRDAAGRPTAAVLLLASGPSIWVDGAQVGPAKPAVIDALRRALAARTELAEQLQVTYTPQVAIAVPRGAPASRHALLAEWATAAGAEGLLLVARSQEGGPAALSLARRGPRPPGPLPPPLIELTRDPAELTLRLGESQHALNLLAGLDPAALGDAVTTLRSQRPAPVGAVLVADFQTNHGRTVEFLDQWRRVAPQLPITTRRP